MKNLWGILCLCTVTLYGQGEANNWFFGTGAGLDFSTSPPRPLLDGQLTTLEGCSSISTPSGQLQFYTDGRNVWNRNHQLMPNADYQAGTGLLGDPSSTSSALIVPDPTQPGIYYVFTVDEPHHENAFAFPNAGPAAQDGSPISLYTDTRGSVPGEDDGFNNGMNYTVVDMSLNGGLGGIDVNQKNIPLLTYDPNDPEQVKYKCSEKITAVKGEDCDAFWIVTHFIDTFYAFEITAAGVNPTPVTSTLGPSLTTDNYRRAAIGYMKISPDGQWLAVAHSTETYDQTKVEDSRDGSLLLYKFDNRTGKVSEARTLFKGGNPYGVEFSSNSERVYANILFDTNRSTILQWDLLATPIEDSRFVIHQDTTEGNAGALQLAPDEKIYRSGFGLETLPAIINPDALGSDVVYTELTSEGAVFLGGRSATLGLPPFIQSIFAKRINIITGDDLNLVTNLKLCEGDTYRLSYTEFAGASYEWSKDGTLLPQTTHFIDIQESGAYTLSINLNNGDCPLTGIASVTVISLDVPPDVTLIQCPREIGSESASFNLEQANSLFVDDASKIEVDYFLFRVDADGNPIRIPDPKSYTNVRNPQRILARITNTETQCTKTSVVDLQVATTAIDPQIVYACDEEDDDRITVFDLSEISSKLQNEIADNLTFAFYATEDEAFEERNPLPLSYTSETTTIYVRAEVDGKCYAIAPVQLEVRPYVFLAADETLTLCLEDLQQGFTLEALVLNAPGINYNYLWEPSGSTNALISVSEVATYTVTVTDPIAGCSAQRIITIEGSEPAMIEDVRIQGFGRENTVSVTVSGIGNYEFALDDSEGNYQDSATFNRVPAGEHQIYIRDKNDCGIVVTDVFSILGFPEFFTPNQDGFNDTWQMLGVPEGQEYTLFLYDRYGRLLRKLTQNDQGWDGTYEGKPLPSDDYWVKVQLDNGQEHTGHFSLVR